MLQAGLNVEIIDGDHYRMSLCKDLGFSKADRCENIRRLGKVAAKFSGENKIAIIAAINPYEESRIEMRNKYGACLVYVCCGLETLIQRDTKGLYARALLPAENPERLSNLSGIDDPFDLPAKADLILNTEKESIEESTERLSSFIFNHLASPSK